MVLSNADRQARFRARLKAKAAGLNVEAEGAAIMDAAFAALWSFYSRPLADGSSWGDLDDHADVASFKVAYRDDPAATLATIAGVLDEDDQAPVTEAERAALEPAAALCRAVMLHHLPAPEKKRLR